VVAIYGIRRPPPISVSVRVGVRVAVRATVRVAVRVTVRVAVRVTVRVAVRVRVRPNLLLCGFLPTEGETHATDGALRVPYMMCLSALVV